MLYTPTDEDKKLFEKMAVCILTPCSGYHVFTKFCKDTANMIAYSWMHGLKVYQMGTTERMVVDWARNDLARKAKDHINEYTGEKFTHLLWLDDDHAFNPDLALFLARTNQDIVSALYFGRTSPHFPVAYVKDFSGDKYKHFPIIEVPNTLIEVDAVGFGATLMRRDVFEKVSEPWFTIDWKCGEDIAFCVKAKEFGYKIMLDGQYKLGHIGVPPIITESTYRQAQEKNPEIFKDKTRINFNG